MPAPMMKFTGSARIVASRDRWLGPLSQLAEISAVNSTVKPMVTTTNAISVQTVERTERTLVHSETSRWPKPPTPPDGVGPSVGVLAAGLAAAGLAGAGAVTGRPRRAARARRGGPPAPGAAGAGA